MSMIIITKTDEILNFKQYTGKTNMTVMQDHIYFVKQKQATIIVQIILPRIKETA